MSSLAELRKELKSIRKEFVRPISKMKKADCAAEIARMTAIHKGEEKKVAEVLAKADVPAKVAKTVKKVQEKEHSKVHDTVKKESKKDDKKNDDMKEKMAKLRALRKKKDQQ